MGKATLLARTGWACMLWISTIALDPRPALAQAETGSTGAAPAAQPSPPADADTAPAPTAPMTGLDVARRMDDAQRTKSEHNVTTMTLENSRGQKRVRTIEGWSQEITRDEEQRFVRFVEPADVKDTTLLTYDYDSRDDDIWLYLPALKKVKRILSSNKTDYFMGSDFTYWDMENIDLVNWSYVLTGAETLDGVRVHVLAAGPKNDAERDESGYNRVVYWIAETDWLPRKIEFTDTKDRLAKRLVLSEVRPTSDADPRPRAHRMAMANLLTDHHTTLAMSKIELDVAVDEDLFSQRNLMP
jgi:hypothetical protein